MIAHRAIAFSSSSMRSALTFIVAFSLFVGGAPARYSSTAASSAASLSAESSPTTIEDERGLVALDQSLREITNPFTVLSIAARPGDEDDGALAFLRKRLGARVVMLFATRGEGEDSPTAGELDEELGSVHTREALEAARVTGSDVFFLNLRDFGYSKLADEALRVWGHDEALRRMTRAIRSLRPDVMITNHDGTSGEGIEQAVTRLALEAFAAAADTTVAPEAGSEAWQTRRFFQPAGKFPAEATINLDQYDHVRGKTYAQLGLAAHQRFRSRGSNLDRMTAERAMSCYKLIRSSSTDVFKPGDGLLDGLKIAENLRRSIEPPRVGDLGVVDAIVTGDRLIEALEEKLIEKRAEGSADTMHERYGAEFVRVVRLTAALERALALALGLSLEITLSDHVVVAGQKLAARLALRNGSRRVFPVVFNLPERLPAPERNSAYKESEVTGAGPGAVMSKEVEYEIAKEAALTLPHSAHLYDEQYYPVGSSLPGAHPPEPFGERLIASVDVGLGQASIRLAALVRFDVAPPIEISTIPFALVKDWSKPRDIEFPVRVHNHTPGPLAGALWVVPLAMTDDNYEPVHIAFVREDDEVSVKLKLRLPVLKPPLASDVLLEFRREKPAVPDPLAAAKIIVTAIDAEVAEGLNVGYIRGLDDWLSVALTELGVQHTELPAGKLSLTEHGNAAPSTQSLPGCGDLARFDTIIVDEQAYFAQPELILNNRCLLRYTKQGGNLVVLSQKPDDWNMILSGSQLTPYPISLSTERITYEASRVTLLAPDHTLLTSPNKITLKDFDGWVVERAINIPRQWSSEYKALVESSDPGEEPAQGTLLVARYGEGTYVFTSFAWRRQLLAGNKGAYRVFANIVSLAKVKSSPAKPQ